MKINSERIRDRRLPPVILHLDVDAFFASVEQVLDPALRGQPVIVGSGVVASCSYESRAYGVRTAMSIAEAKRVCPDGVFLAGDYGNYALFANRIAGICHDFTPVVEQASLDDFYLDLTGCVMLSDCGLSCPLASSSPHARSPASFDSLGLARAIQTQIRAETALSCSLGVGRNKLFAKLVSDAAKPGGIIEVRPDEEAEWLARLPVSELPGAGPKVCAELARYNVHTVVQLTALSESILLRLFGANGRTLWERARGIDDRPVKGDAGANEDNQKSQITNQNSPARLPHSTQYSVLDTQHPTPHTRHCPGSLSRETTLERPTADDVFLRGMLSYLVQRAARELRRQRCAARTLSVKLRYGDFQTVNASRTLPEASCEDRVFVGLAYELFLRLYTRRLPVRHLGVELAQLRATVDGQRLLFDETRERSRRQLRRAVDRVRDRFGFQSIIEGAAASLIDRLDQDRRGFRLRTPSLSR